MQPPPDEDVGCGSASKGGLARVGYPWDRWARPISHHQFSPLHVPDSRFKQIACTGVLAAIRNSQIGQLLSFTSVIFQYIQLKMENNI